MSRISDHATVGKGVYVLVVSGLGSLYTWTQLTIILAICFDVKGMARGNCDDMESREAVGLGSQYPI